MNIPLHVPTEIERITDRQLQCTRSSQLPISSRLQNHSIHKEATMSIVKLTQSIIANELHCPDGKTRVELCDRELPGLYVEVRATPRPGHVSTWRYKNSTGKTCHQKIGRTSDIDLAEARKRAKKLKAEIALGANPRGEAKAQKEVPTFDTFFVEHYLPYVEAREKLHSGTKNSTDCGSRQVFGNRRLNQITRQQLQTFHTELLSDGSGSGNDATIT